MHKVVFLDRDGVINKRAEEHEYITSWDEFQFLPNAPQAIKRLNEAEYKVVIISNQRCVARGIMSAAEVDALHNQMLCALRDYGAIVDAVYYCPHNTGECNCRKPGIGLFLKAEESFKVEKKRSYMIGDSESDIAAGRNYGVHTAAIGADYEMADIRSKDLYGAVDEILERTER